MLVLMTHIEIFLWVWGSCLPFLLAPHLSLPPVKQRLGVARTLASGPGVPWGGSFVKHIGSKARGALLEWQYWGKVFSV